MSDVDVKYDPTVGEKIVQLRNDGAKWGEIAASLGLPGGKALLYYEIASVNPKQRIKNAAPADVVRLRDEQGLSWGRIVALTMIPESRLRSIYEEATGNSTKGNRIGKGGRYPNGTDRPEPKVKTPREPKAPKAAKEKAEPKATERSATAAALDGMDAEGIMTHLTGRGVQVQGKTGPVVVKIRSVKTVKDGVIVVVDDETAKSRTIRQANILAVTKGKVVKPS